MVLDLKGKFESIVELTPTVKLFTISFDSDFDFVAGQFVNISFEKDGELYRKSYSIGSAPSLKGKIQLCIKLVEGGRVTPKLWEMKEGDFIDVKGPLGLFTLAKSKKNKLYFIGTGTGIAPLRSMIFDMLEKGIEKEIVLIFGCRNESDILFQNDFECLEQEHPNFKFVKVVSRPSENWEGRKGHVQENFDMVDCLNGEAYLCGLPLMVDAARDKLKELGMAEDCISHERFN